MQLTLRGCSCLSCTNQADFLPQNSQNSQNLLAVIFSHRFHRSAQNLLVEKGLPQISQIYTDVGGYGILAIPTQPSYCDFLPQISQICTEPSYCDFLPQISLICTEPSRCDFLPQISLICTEPSRCDFLPQISQICAEPSRCDFPPPQNLQNSQNLLAAIFSHRFHRSAQNLLVEKGLPQIARIYTDVGGYGILPYPRNH